MSRFPTTFRCPELPFETNTSGLKVLLPGRGQTGTTSVVHALHEMGFKTWHAEDMLTFGPAATRKNVDGTKYARAFRNCGVEAASLEPLLDFDNALQTSPGAIVIETVRPFKPHMLSAFNGGTKDLVFLINIRLLSSSAMAVPWLLLADQLTGCFSQLFTLEESRMIVKPNHLNIFFWLSYAKARLLTPDVNYHHRGSYAPFEDSTADNTVEDIFIETRRQNKEKTIAAGSKYFEFDVRRDGWRRLSEITGQPAPHGPDAPFPHPRTKGSWFNAPEVESDMPRFRRLCIVWVTLHIANWYIFWAVVRLVMRPCQAVREKQD